ncbi:MAG: tripartite tricarboxylate transporter substrate-binding protein [Rhodospirillaceae bacterium]
MNRIFKTALIAGAVAAAIGGPVATAKDYKGKTITIVIPYGPGGTYDKYGQTFARYLGKHVPGKPTMIVQHMPGAGGLKAMNWAHKVMPKDGAHMITPLDNSVVNQLLRPEKVRYDSRNFTWVGSSNQTNIVLVVRGDTGIKSVADMKNKKGMIAGASGKASTGYLFPGLMRGLFGLDLKIVTGYSGSRKTIFSVERGETQMAAYNWLAWDSMVPHWFKGETPIARAIVQIGVFRDPDLPKTVPMLSDLVSKELDKKAVDFIKVLGLLGRGLALPPGVSKDAVATLRSSYDKMNADPTFAAELKKRSLRLIPSKGTDIQKLVNSAIDNATPAVVKHARQLIYGKES